MRCRRAWDPPTSFRPALPLLSTWLLPPTRTGLPSCIAISATDHGMAPPDFAWSRSSPPPSSRPATEPVCTNSRRQSPHLLDLAVDVLDLLLQPQLQVVRPGVELLNFLFEVTEVASIDVVQQP